MALLKQNLPGVSLTASGFFILCNMELKLSQLNPHPDNAKIYGVEDVQELAEQIRQSEWIKPLVVTDFYGGFTIVSGHRRFAAACKLALNAVPCELVKFQADWQVMERLLLENDSREKTFEQRTREYSMRKKVEEERAKFRFGGRHKDESTVEKFPPLNEGKSRDLAAEQSGFGSGKTAEAAEVVVKAIDKLREEGEEEKADLLKQSLEQKNVSGTKAILEFIEKLSKEDAAKYADDLMAGRKTTTQVKKLIETEQRRAEVKEALQEQKLEPTEKKYRIVYADPPWKYGNAMPEYVTEPQDYYLLMDTADICAMPIKDIVEKDAVLFLWSTSPHLPEALEVVKAWGFSYKTTFIWDKVKHNMGHYNSVRHEILLVCTRGACTPDVKKLFDSVVSIERGEHSKKPEYFREIIETLYTYGNKIELFARAAPEGWDVFGNQTNKA